MKETRKSVQVREIMTTEVRTVAPETPLKEVAALLVEHRISAVPVVDTDNRVVGIVSEGDLLRRSETGTEQHRSRWIEFFVSGDALAREYVKAHGKKASEVMTRHVLCATETMSLREVADILDHNKIKRLPVLCEGKLVGIISRGDIVRALLASETSTPDGQARSSDRRIRAELGRRLKAQAWSQSVYLQSTVHGGAVEFFGFAHSEEQRRALRVLAETIPGVTRVDDRTTVTSRIFAG